MAEQTHKKPVPEMGRRERRRMETREKIYHAAMELFAKRGYLGTTTEDITNLADVGQGTFFNYFPTKGHVLLVLSEKQLGKVSAGVQEVIEAGLPVREFFQHFIHKIVEELAKTQALTRSLLTAFCTEEALRHLMAESLATGREGLAEICALGQRRGEIRSDRKPAELALTFQRNVLGTLLLWAMQSKGDLHAWLEKTLDDFWEIAAAKKR